MNQQINGSNDNEGGGGGASLELIMSDILEYNNRAVQHLRRGNSSEAVLILLKTVFKLRKARARSRARSQSVSSGDGCGEDQQEQEQDQEGPLTQEDFVTATAADTASNNNNNESAEPDDDVPEESHDNNSSMDSFLTNIPLSDWPKSRSNRSNNPSDPSNLPENVFMLFDHAFIAQSDTFSSFNNTGRSNQELAYAFILYNMGLALHIKGMEHEKHSQSLHLAVKFYKLSLGVLEDACDDGRPTEVCLLLLALFNNMGHIKSHFADIKEALHCVQWLRSLVTAKSPLMLPQLRDEHSFFTLSALIPPGSEFALAPAA